MALPLGVDDERNGETDGLWRDDFFEGKVAEKKSDEFVSSPPMGLSARVWWWTDELLRMAIVRSARSSLR